MKADIVQVDQYEDGKYDWKEDAIVIKPDTLTEATYLKNLFSGKIRTTIRLFDQESYNTYLKVCEENHAKRILEEEKLKEMELSSDSENLEGKV